jgi:hypothetical protein
MSIPPHPSSVAMKVGNIELPTSNFQHPMMTPNAIDWTFDVGCWLLDVFSQVQGLLCNHRVKGDKP